MAEIVSREEWGARTPTSRKRISIPVAENWLHHTAGSESGAAGMRSIQNYHMDKKRWSDIGYSWVYDPKNRIWFEGRGWAYSGAHTYGHNSVSHGFCVMGNFQNESVTPAIVDDVAEFIARSHKKGYGPDKFTGGHRDVGSTACPGDNLYNKISEINSKIKTYLEGGNNMPERYDKTSKDYFQNAYNWAVDQGIFSDATHPSHEVNAEKLAVFLKRAAESSAFNKSHGHSTYADKEHEHDVQSVESVTVEEVIAELQRRLQS